MIAALSMNSPWWLAAGWTMVHFLWIGTVVGILAAAGRWLMPSRPELRYIFALTCFAFVSVAPVCILAAMQPVGHVQAPTSVVNGDWVLSTEGRVEVPSAIVPPLAEALPAERSLLTLSDMVRYLPWLWLIGTPLTALMVVAGLIGSERLRRLSQPQADGDLADRCRRLANLLGVRCHVTIGVCSRIAAPILVGIIKPMILVPPAALTGWSIDQLEMVLLHELAHVRRWDNLVNLMQRIVEALLFFHPVIWWLSAWIRLEREVCCDRVVVAHTGDPRAYAETLALLAMPESVNRTGALAMAENRLVVRIRRILNLEDRSMTVSTKWFGFSSALLFVSIVVVGVYGFSDDTIPAIKGTKQQDVVPEKDKKPVAIKGDGQAKSNAVQQPVGGKKGRTPGTVKDIKGDVRNIQDVLLRGSIEAYQRAELYSRVAGIVKTVKVEDGERVKRGQVLIELDATDSELELKQQEAMVLQAKAETEQAKTGVQAARAVLEAAKALMQEAQASQHGAWVTQEYRKKVVERYVELAKSNGVVPQSTLDEVKEKLDAAQAAQDASRARLQAAKATVDESSAKIARAQADFQVAVAHVAVAEAGLQRTRAILDSATLRAPFDGVIVHRNAGLGAYSQAAGQLNAYPLVTVARTDMTRVVFYLREDQLSKIGKGAPAIIKVDAMPNHRFEGKIARLGSEIDHVTGALRAEIDLPNPDGRFLPGLTCTVKLEVPR